MSNVEIVRGAYEAFARGDVPSVLGAMSSAVQWREAENNPYRPDGEPWVGPDAVLQNLFVKLGEDWEFFHVLPQQYHDAGEVVVVEARYRAKHKVTGKPLDAQVCHVWRVRDGKLDRFQQYTDTAQLQDAMGFR